MDKRKSINVVVTKQGEKWTAIRRNPVYAFSGEDRGVLMRVDEVKANVNLN